MSRLTLIANAVPWLGIQIRLSEFRIERQTSGDLYPIAPLRKVDGAKWHPSMGAFFLKVTKLMASDLQTQQLRLLEDKQMQIVNLMTSDPITIDQHDTLSKAKTIMDAGRFRRLPVMDDGRLVGIVTERDLREYTGYLESTRVTAAMRTPLITVTPYNTVEDAALLMLKHKIGGLPIVSDGTLVGIVTTTDLLKAFLNVVKATSEIVQR
ncbi:MAG TPA: CBS domain-containing protein [Candidatus Binatus sp.]|uniref:CBS domain-containing protein n=1 Tax=Candidatus Binatus sp. TaxID=2811406 RepID=UPI002F4280D4